MDRAEDAGVTRDAFFGGRLTLAQPARGHRSGTDAVLLAAAIPEGADGLCYDMGAGVGVVGLGAALLEPALGIVLVENDPAMAEIARANCTVATVAGRAAVALCDILDRTALRAALPARAGLVLTNPPFHDPRAGRASPVAGRATAHRLADGATLADWLAACLDRLDDGGTIVAIVAAAAVPDALRAMGAGAGGLALKPVHPREGRPAHRALLRATKGSRAPFSLAAPLVLHEGERFTAEAAALHAGAARLVW